MTNKEITAVLCVGGLLVIGFIIFIIARSNKKGCGFPEFESILELGVIILDLLSSILSGL